MIEARTYDIGGRTVVLMDAIEALQSEHAERIVVAGSHGGLGPARAAIQHPPRLVVFHDAGIGKDAAGTAGLRLLSEFRIAAATVSAASARIGDAEDMLQHGRISDANEAARKMGCEAGRLLKDVIAAIPQRSR